MKSIWLFLLMAFTGIASARGQHGLVTLYAQPTSDGELIDGSEPWDNIPDRVADGEKIARITASFREEKAAVIEFPLPPADVEGIPKLRKAMLVLFSNEKGLAPITVQLFAYWDEAADGVINLGDWERGDYLGDILVGEQSEISVLNRWPAFDVTEAVQKAMGQGANAIGFFLRASEDSRAVDRGIVMLRTAEFGMQFEQYKPSLELYFE